MDRDQLGMESIWKFPESWNNAVRGAKMAGPHGSWYLAYMVQPGQTIYIIYVGSWNNAVRGAKTIGTPHESQYLAYGVVGMYYAGTFFDSVEEWKAFDSSYFRPECYTNHLRPP